MICYNELINILKIITSSAKVVISFSYTETATYKIVRNLQNKSPASFL